MKSHWLKIPKVHQSASLLKSEKIALDEYSRLNARALDFLNDAFYETFSCLKSKPIYSFMLNVYREFQEHKMRYSIVIFFPSPFQILLCIGI